MAWEKLRQIKFYFGVVILIIGIITCLLGISLFYLNGFKIISSDDLFFGATAAGIMFCGGLLLIFCVGFFSLRKIKK